MTAGTQSPDRSEYRAGPDQFDQWRELVGQTRVCDATSAHVDTFTAQARRTALGPVALLGTSFPSARFRRTERMIRSSDEEFYHLTLLTAGASALRRGRDQKELFGTGDLQLIDSSHPYDGRFFDADGSGGGEPQVAGVGIDLPVSLLSVSPDRLRDLLGRRLSGREGTGALLAEFLLGLERQAAVLGADERYRLGTVALDLAAVWLARELDVETAVTPGARQRVLVESVRSYVRRNLHDPGLTPPAIAAAHYISVSYLNRLFARQSQGDTVAAWIRAQRLRGANRDLADPVQRAVPIHAIGARWGIPRASDFSRAFKAAYGLSPREHRQQSLSESESESES
ncbi:helix-turn-helix domain-containing protein [Streptomyces sp. 1331.2]|uniref:helix-turn-helix domain-containing protein n=1 Tax=Streptomyces sp. 1331.2 TaxID=1938835 RepID=UPI000BD108F4|nr:helix-turn-helix domain-containing protein [Streptomyces sp. 1331.2]SOB78775.1 transcriptional regulator, AraC family [Streptomyces sp. 1331.2]